MNPTLRLAYLSYQLLYIFSRSFAFLVFLMLVGCQTYEMPLGRMQVSDQQYKEVFYVTEATPRPKPNRTYQWFKSQEVFSSQNDYAGELLDGNYTKYYYTNQLAEKGELKKGLKVGKWISWHKNGTVSEIINWKKGRKSGCYIAKDSFGSALAMGRYRKNLKKGKWVYPLQGDTIFFKKGHQLKRNDTTLKDIKKQKSFLGRIFKKEDAKKRKDSINSEKAVPQTNRPRVTSSQKVDDEEKVSFFKRLFKKRTKTKENVRPVSNSQNNRRLNESALEKNQKEKKPSFLRRLFSGKKEVEKANEKND